MGHQVSLIQVDMSIFIMIMGPEIVIAPEITMPATHPQRIWDSESDRHGKPFRLWERRDKVMT